MRTGFWRNDKAYLVELVQPVFLIEGQVFRPYSEKPQDSGKIQHEKVKKFLRRIHALGSMCHVLGLTWLDEVLVTVSGMQLNRATHSPHGQYANRRQSSAKSQTKEQKLKSLSANCTCGMSIRVSWCKSDPRFALMLLLPEVLVHSGAVLAYSSWQMSTFD